MPSADNEKATEQQSARFLWLYALAAAGGAVAYVPFLTILLPDRISNFAGDTQVNVVAYGAFAGAIAASLANIGFGWISDKTGVRRPWIAVGMVLSGILLMAMHRVESLMTLLPLLVLWQLALNMMLAPLNAWAGDTVPHAQKGYLGGLLAFAPALGALSGALVTLPGMAGQDTRLVLIAILVVLMITPVLLFGRPRAMPHLMRAEEPQGAALPKQTITARMWIARLLVQIAEAALFAFLLFWFRSIDPTMTDNDTAGVFSLVLCLSVPLALAAGRWSDSRNRPFLPLVTGAASGAIGLLFMAFASNLTIGIFGYLLFGITTNAFLALHSAQTLRVLRRPEKRGRDLGIFNLTNTVPSLIMPWITIALVPRFGFDALFLFLAGLCVVASCTLLSVRRN